MYNRHCYNTGPYSSASSSVLTPSGVPEQYFVNLRDNLTAINLNDSTTVVNLGDTSLPVTLNDPIVEVNIG